MRLKRPRSTPSATANGGEAVSNEFPVSSPSHLRRIEFGTQLWRGSLSERNAGNCLANFVRGKDRPIQLAGEPFRDSALARADPTHHDKNQWLGAADSIPKRETKIASRLFLVFLRIGRFSLCRLDTFHLPADEGAIALVEICYLWHACIPQFACSISEKQIPHVASAFEIKIHRQKGEIVGDVDETKPIVELNAIEDGRRFRREMDVIEMQIAMAIKNPMLLNTFVEQVFIQLVELVCVMTNRLEGGR